MRLANWREIYLDKEDRKKRIAKRAIGNSQYRHRVTIFTLNGF